MRAWCTFNKQYVMKHFKNVLLSYLKTMFVCAYFVIEVLFHENIEGYASKLCKVKIWSTFYKRIEFFVSVFPKTQYLFTKLLHFLNLTHS